jgi:hypothetical protein
MDELGFRWGAKHGACSRGIIDAAGTERPFAFGRLTSWSENDGFIGPSGGSSIRNDWACIHLIYDPAPLTNYLMK